MSEDHLLTAWETTTCTIERVRAMVDDGECSACGNAVVCAEHRNVVPCPDCTPRLRFTDRDIWPEKCTNCGRDDLRMHPSGSGKCWPCGEDIAAPK